MLGVIIAALVGWSVKKLWPYGIAFLLLWPAVAVAIMLPIARSNLAEFGETLEITPAVFGRSYLQTLIAVAVIFFIAFGVRGWRDQRSLKKEISDNNAPKP